MVDPRMIPPKSRVRCFGPRGGLLRGAARFDNDTYAVMASRTERPMASKLVAYHGSDTAAELTVPLLVVRG